MDIIYRGHRADYNPPKVSNSEEVLTGQFRGHQFSVRKQVRVNPFKSPYRMKFRGH